MCVSLHFLLFNFSYTYLISFSGFYEVPQCFFVVSCYGITNASEILQTERQPLESTNEGESVPAFISYFILYKVTQEEEL